MPRRGGSWQWRLSLPRGDYDEGCCHNVDLFERDALVLTVPYDLDLSGIVNASYAFPDVKLRIKKVTQRLYRGLCMDRATLQRAVDKIVSRKDRIVAAVEGTPGLAEDNRRKAVNFLGRFFDNAANRDKFIKSLERRCIGK